MSAEYATFGLAPVTRGGGVVPGGAHRTHRASPDFVVDGRPLLLRLSELDAVSPLAADVPPVVPVGEVRALLLDAPPPLAGGRCVIYACPECRSLECGAVTAVVERDGDAVRWRDFAWQTSALVDPARDRYPGVGPFRFRAAGYRAALERLLAESTESTDSTESVEGAGSAVVAASRDRRRVVLTGARDAVLVPLRAALHAGGIGADIAPDPTRPPAGELRDYAVVAFGRAAGEAERAAVRAAFADAGAEPVYVSGLAPVVPLLAAQIEQALDDRRADPRRPLTALTAGDGAALLTVATACRVRLTAYRAALFHRTRETPVFAGTLEPGEHRIALDGRAVRGASFLVARTLGGVLTAAVARRGG
ncbi:oxidoreductase [Streptomyces sp. CAU 1734]|uniref:oxidoreductase n=1 Tax=Streptomyces sp. CAU 1734 TaxID=3140360 RepID=UPI003260B0CE